VQSLCCSAKVQFLSNNDKVAQMAQFHREGE
jgi:hypothetical protein